MALSIRDIKRQTLEGKVARYDQIRSQMKALSEEKDELSKEIKEFAYKEGVKDSSGSYYCDNDGFVFGSVAKTVRKINQEKAIAFFKEMGYLRCIKKVEVVNEAMVERYLDEGKLTVEDLEDITDSTTTYSVSVTCKEEMPEVEQTSFSMAASRKPKLRVRR